MNNLKAGLYIHIPFCRRKCPYCDFFITTNRKWIDEYYRALKNELHYLKQRFNPQLLTIYFGGGTPSFFPIKNLEGILNYITKEFSIVRNAEWTVEVNPEDVNEEFIRLLSASPINRISVGVQSFNDAELSFLGRQHTSKQAIQSIESLKKIIENVSVDIIYGLPEQSNQTLLQTLQTIKQLEVPHFSAYMLTIENRTLFGVLAKHNKLSISEDLQASLFEMLIHWANDNGYVQYEISNFVSSEKFYSKHNLLYWNNENVFNAGAGAHGSWTNEYGIRWRRINKRNIYIWIKAYLNNYLPPPMASFEFPLSQKEFYNESILNNLRTMWGIDIKLLRKLFPKSFISHLISATQPFIEANLLKLDNDRLFLTPQGKLYADYIASSLMLV